MTGRPAIPAHFQKGKYTFEIDNVTDTLNWLISCLSELKANAGVSITGLLDGAPRIGLKLVEGNGVQIESTPGGSKKISCTGGGSLTVNVGDSDYTGVNTLGFTSASDSAVTFSASQSGGALTLTIGVHYAD